MKQKVMVEVEVTEMCLCEQDYLLLKPYRLYKFIVDLKCKRCLELYERGMSK